MLKNRDVQGIGPKTMENLTRSLPGSFNEKRRAIAALAGYSDLTDARGYQGLTRSLISRVDKAGGIEVLFRLTAVNLPVDRFLREIGGSAPSKVSCFFLDSSGRTNRIGQLYITWSKGDVNHNFSVGSGKLLEIDRVPIRILLALCFVRTEPDEEALHFVRKRIEERILDEHNVKLTADLKSILKSEKSEARGIANRQTWHVLAEKLHEAVENENSCWDPVSFACDCAEVVLDDTSGWKREFMFFVAGYMLDEERGFKEFERRIDAQGEPGECASQRNEVLRDLILSGTNGDIKKAKVQFKLLMNAVHPDKHSNNRGFWDSVARIINYEWNEIIGNG